MKGEDMKRHMLNNAIDINEFESHLRDDTKAWLRRSSTAKVLYKKFVDKMNMARAWYDKAKEDESITRWVPQGGGGDCYIIFPAECRAYEARGAFNALCSYAYSIGRCDINNDLNDAWLMADYSEKE